MTVKKENITKFRLDPKHPPKLTASQRKRLEAMKDEDIDTSDIPELGASFWKNAKFFHSSDGKEKISLNLDKDILAFFRKSGRGYQTRINSVLRAYVAQLNA